MKPHQRLEMEMMRDELNKIMPALLGVYPAIAQASFSYFSELKKAGFSEQEALKIVAQQGFMGGVNNSGE